MTGASSNQTEGGFRIVQHKNPWKLRDQLEKTRREQSTEIWDISRKRDKKPKIGVLHRFCKCHDQDMRCSESKSNVRERICRNIYGLIKAHLLLLTQRKRNGSVIIKIEE